MSHEAPGKHFREGLTLIDFIRLFPDNEAAAKWFESIIWPNGRHCPKCGSTRTAPAKHKTMPYWCSDCRSFFSVRTGTVLQKSNVPLQKWALAIYLCTTSLKSVSSMKLHRDIGVSQKTAWHMLHRIRMAWSVESDDDSNFDGPVEVDETYVGGKKKPHIIGRGPVGKTPVIGMRDRATGRIRARVVEKANQETARGFISEYVNPNATVYTDESPIYSNLPFRHKAITHSVAEWVNGQTHTNSIESFWSMLKRAHKGVFHKISNKHLNRYVQEFVAKRNMREMDTLDQMEMTVARMIGRKLPYSELTA